MFSASIHLVLLTCYLVVLIIHPAIVLAMDESDQSTVEDAVEDASHATGDASDAGNASNASNQQAQPLLLFGEFQEVVLNAKTWNCQLMFDCSEADDEEPEFGDLLDNIYMAPVTRNNLETGSPLPNMPRNARFLFPHTNRHELMEQMNCWNQQT